MLPSSTTGSGTAVVTVARDYGARGVEVARLVAERLGVRLWDRDLVAEVAADMHVDPSVLAGFDEHRTESPEPPTPVWPSRADYQDRLAIVARIVASRGAAVLVGRGLGGLFGPDTCLRVHVVCPIEQRIAGLIERSQLSAETARAAIDYVDREREAFARDMSGGHLAEPSTHDLTISTGNLSLAAAAEVVVSAYRSRFGEPRRQHHRSTPTMMRDMGSSRQAVTRGSSSR
jgi:cytidylate kinase